MPGTITLPAFFSSNLVLQRCPAEPRLWGWVSSASKPVTLVVQRVDGTVQHVARTVADTSGAFRITLPPLPAGGPYTLSVYSPEFAPAVTLENVMFGDVFFCSGQSNMRYTMARIDGAETELGDTDYPDLRLFAVDNNRTSDVRVTDVYSDDTPYLWAASSRDTVDGGSTYYSAVCYLFGRELLKEYPDTPVGLIVAPASGSPIHSFMSAEARSACGSGDDGGVFNAEIYPFYGMALRGALWYQGETDRNSPDSYPCKFAAMVGEWRQQFGDPRLAVGYVQLPSNGTDEYGDFVEIRAAQAQGLTDLEAVTMATTIDLGMQSGAPVHPKYKKEVALRLYAGMRNLLYDRHDVAEGPRIESAWFDAVSGSVVLDLDPTTSAGLSFAGTRECSSCCAEDQGAFDVLVDGSWEAVTHAVTGDHQITLTAPALSSGAPTSMRFGWHNFVQCALYNGDGFPMTPVVADVR